jgi:hypothetical protein
VLLAVNVGAVATPEALVVAVAVAPLEKVPVAPDTVLEVNVTVVPLTTGFPPESVTVATIGLANAVLMAMLWLVGALSAIEAAGPETLVSWKGVARVAEPEVTATVKVPLVELAVNTAVVVATPDALVVAVLTPPAKVAVAPPTVAGVKVTVAPETGLLPASVTVTESAA